jgi:hypothetical protein
MTDRGAPVAIRILDAAGGSEVLKALRAVTNESFSQLRNSLTQRTPIPLGHIFSRDHDEVESRLLTLLQSLEELDAEYEIILDGQPEPREYLTNQLQQWRETGIETQMMTDLELGEPDMETLEWLKRESPRDVYRQTLEQIARGDGYNVAPKTLAWVKDQLESH